MLRIIFEIYLLFGSSANQNARIRARVTVVPIHRLVSIPTGILLLPIATSLLWAYWGSAFVRALDLHDPVAANELNTLVNRLVPSFISRTSERRLHPHTRTRPTHHVCTVLSWLTGGPLRRIDAKLAALERGLERDRWGEEYVPQDLHLRSIRHLLGTPLDASQTTLTTIQNVFRDVATPPSPDDILPCLPKAPSTSENNRTDYHSGERH